MSCILNLLEKLINVWVAHLPRRTPDPIKPGQIGIVAHRGAHNHVLIENTLDAFEHALNLKCYGIEFDVHACADGVLVVHHDETLQRLWGHDVLIHTITFDTLRILAPKIPTLAEVVDQYGKKLHLYIELKSYLVEAIILEDTLKNLRPVVNYHLLSLDESYFPRLNRFPKASMLLVPVHNNVNHFCELSLRLHYGGVLGHYLLLHQRQITALLDARQVVGVGFIDSKYSLYRELNRGLPLLFTNNAATLTSDLQALIQLNTPLS